MKISVDTINRHFEKPLSTEEIVLALEKTEVEIEEVLKSVSLDKKIVTAEILKINNHPNADKLHLVDIKFGKNKKTKVVCGASNLELGTKVVYAQVGAILPAGNKIEKIKIRGVESRGMLCSEAELGISNDHSGIHILDPDLPLGLSLCDIDNYSDILDIKTPTNRWDMLSSLGLAREIFSNSKNCSLKELPLSKIQLENNNNNNAIVKNQKDCKRIITIELNLKKPISQLKSPRWVVDNLKASDIRPINPVVDITNYVMLETGQPSHAYDATKLKGKLQVRNARKNEKIITLDGKNRTLQKSDLIISDSADAIGIAGVMGGKSTEVDEKTTNILLEIANFDKTVIRKSAMSHKLRTEASARFEKGLPLPLCEFAAKRLVNLFENLCQANLKNKTVHDQLFAWPWIQHVGLRIRKAEKFLGVEFSEKQILEGLKRRGFTAEHFSIVKEARKHLGKPYKWGANYKQDGTDAFDCSYLIDYVYSLIGVNIGHTALAQFHHGNEIDVKNLKPGDVVFYEGLIENSTTKHFYLRDEGGNHRKKVLKSEKKVGHNGIYIGQNKVIMAAKYEYKNKKWILRKNPSVVEVDLNEFTKNPGYLGARRYVENFNHTIATTAPWWRNDIKIEQDLYEECAKIIGYENIPATLPQLPPMNNFENQMISKLQVLKDILIARGLFEVMTYSFVSRNYLDSQSYQANEQNLKIINPLSSEQAYLRSSLFISQLLTAAKNNTYYQKEYGFFEVSRVYQKSNNKLGKNENWQLAISIVGNKSLEKLKSYIQTIEECYNWKLNYQKLVKNGFVQTRGAILEINNSEIGFLAEINKSTLHKVKINTEMSYLEIKLDENMLTIPAKKVNQVPNYQLIERDITIEISNKTWWNTIEKIITKNQSIYKVVFLSDYSNDDLRKNSKKRISFRLIIDCGAQPTVAEIDKTQSDIINDLAKTKEIASFKVI